jgi:16S rRNA (adenine1518-N6/adenine1519-N6)-dimethyltransferase
VMIAYYGEAKMVSPISRRAFYPIPNVDSVLVGMDRKTRSVPEDPEWLFAVARAAFSQRRKTLRNALASIAGVDAAEAAVAEAGIAPSTRAEELDLERFVVLSDVLARHTPGA